VNVEVNTDFLSYDYFTTFFISAIILMLSQPFAVNPPVAFPAQPTGKIIGLSSSSDLHQAQNKSYIWQSAKTPHRHLRRVLRLIVALTVPEIRVGHIARNLIAVSLTHFTPMARWPSCGKNKNLRSWKRLSISNHSAGKCWSPPP